MGRRPDRVRLRSHEVVRSADSTVAACVLRVPQQRPRGPAEDHRADAHLRSPRRRVRTAAGDQPSLLERPRSHVPAQWRNRLRFRTLRLQPAMQSRSTARRDVVQPVRDAAGRLRDPAIERQQGRRLPAALPGRRHDRLHAVGVPGAEPDADSVAVVRAAGRHLGRRVVQAAHERPVGVGGRAFDPGHAAAEVRGDCGGPSYAGGRAGRRDQRRRRIERSGGNPDRHAGRVAAGRRDVGHAGDGRRRAGRWRPLHDPLAALGEILPGRLQLSENVASRASRSITGVWTKRAMRCT